MSGGVRWDVLVSRAHPAAGRGTPTQGAAYRDLDVQQPRAALPSRGRGGGGHGPAGLLTLQGLAGNSAVAALLDAGRPRPAGTDSGTPLPVEVRGRLEHSFGVPLDHVRLHRGPDAARTAQALNARAFTVGEHIGFPPRLSPRSAEGERLLAHEVAHVVQQGPRAAANTATGQRTSRGDGTERSAEHAADLAVRGQPVGPLTPAPRLVARDGVFSAVEWLGDQATQLKEAGYRWLIERLRQLHRAGIARLMSYGERLTGTQRTLWQGIVGCVDMTMTILEGLVYAVVGIVAGFVTGILQMLVGLLRLLVGVFEGILRYLYGLIDGGKAYEAWASDVARTISLIPQGLRMLVDDWLAEFRTASPEKAGLMIGELTGQILAFLATLGVSAGKAGSAAQSAKLAPKLAALIETTPRALATTTGVTVPVAVEIAPETARAIAATVVRHGSAATEAAALTSMQMAAHGGGPSHSGGGSGQGKPPSRRTGPARTTPKAPGPGPSPATAADEAARLAAWRKLGDMEFEAFLDWARSEGSTEVVSGERLELQAHGAASEIRARYGLSGDHQSMHGLPRSTARDLPGYDPKASLTVLGERELHAGIDEGWKQAFQQMRRQGRVDVTAGEVFDEVAKSIDRSPQLSAGTKQSLISRLWDEMFKEYALEKDRLLRLPYPNIPAAP